MKSLLWLLRCIVFVCVEELKESMQSTVVTCAMHKNENQRIRR
jgi:hypothetical protein